jgi:hypothetical protein
MNIEFLYNKETVAIIVCVLLLLMIFLTFFLFFLLKKISILRKKYNNFMKGVKGKDLDGVLEKCLKNIKLLTDERNQLKTEIENIRLNISECVQNVGIIRFNAFDNVGSDLSFSIALLDDKLNGVVFSSLFSRETAVTYGKPVIGGKSSYALSEEEIEAIKSAKKNSITKINTVKDK